MLKRKIIKHLKQLADDSRDPLNLEEGICDEIKYTFGGEVALKIKGLMPYWKKYSGNPLYPVPCSVGGDPKLRYVNTKDLWRGNYGKNRKELCLYLAKVLESNELQNI